MTGALPLPIRNRLAELILESFDDPEARMTLAALDAACGGAPLPPGAADRIRALGWFEPAGGGWRLRGGYRAHQSTLSRRVRAALALPGEAGSADDPTTPLHGRLQWMYTTAPMQRFGGGTNEIQRAIIAQRGLGLPRK